MSYLPLGVLKNPHRQWEKFCDHSSTFNFEWIFFTLADVVEGSVLFYSSRLASVMSGSVFEVFRMGWSYKKDNISW